MRRGIKEVNADKLGAQQRIASVGDDHECFLSKFKDLVHSLSFSPPLTCGLGDVAGALPKALSKRGHRVMSHADII
ncbi:hypothetical protein ZWY2020_024001 [Hordeum vulgare]|nr:hypothetical protein ZWY2020_024001 [Hordeum vulgare]